MNEFLTIHPALNTLSIPLWKYFIFFVMGTLIKKYFQAFLRMLDNSKAMAILLLAFIVSLLLWYREPCQNIWGIKLKFIGWGSMAICIIFAWFRKHEAMVSQQTSVGKSLQYIGRHTLDIYLLHYFFLPSDWGFMGKFFTSYPNPTAEVFVTFVLASTIIIICLTVSSVLRLSPALAYWLFGGKG